VTLTEILGAYWDWITLALLAGAFGSMVYTAARWARARVR
jgi:hypothetical protein